MGQAAERLGWRWLLAVCGLVLLLLSWLGIAQPRALPLGIHTVRADDAMLQEVNALGAQQIVQVFSWSDIQPSRERWDWEYTDWLVRAAEYYNLAVVARLDKPPPWAVDDATALSAPPRLRSDYTTFVHRVAERYRGRVTAYIVWNEPNLAVEWGNRPPVAAQYAELLRAAAGAIRAADPHARVLAAALAPTNENSTRAQDDRVYLEALYAAGAQDTFDALAAHPYAFALAPDVPRTANGGLTFARLNDLYAIMVRHGDTAKPVWITEFGYPTEQPPGLTDRVVNETLQAQYLGRAFILARDQLPWVEAFTVWNLSRDLPASDEQSGYSLLRADGSRKPAYEAVRQLQSESLRARLNSLAMQLDQWRRGPSSAVPIIARDTIVHLGDSDLPAPFVPLYKYRNPAVEWKGEFYLSDADLLARQTAPWTLSLELMQVNDFDSRIWVNDVPLQPAYLPVEDFTSKWVTARFAVPPNTLRVGYNALALRDGKLLPAFQQLGFTWDEFQFRNVQLLPP